MAAPVDNFPFGPLNAADRVTSFLEHRPDGPGNFPNDPVLPPNPVFEFSPAAPVIAALGFQPPIIDGLQSDLLI